MMNSALKIRNVIGNSVQQLLDYAYLDSVAYYIGDDYLRLPLSIFKINYEFNFLWLPIDIKHSLIQIRVQR